jgi:formate hydrogenlyase subunit 3/multisubunit Na+/H+ antiporter MnhD subunit
MGYVLFGLSLFPFQEPITGTVLHLVNHAVSKGLFFLSAGAVMKQLEIRDIREMGGLQEKCQSQPQHQQQQPLALREYRHSHVS